MALLDGRPELSPEVAAAPAELRLYLSQQFGLWRRDAAFCDALAGHLLPDNSSQARLPLILKRIEAIAAVE